MPLQIHRQIRPLRAQLHRAREQGQRIALVATMGNLHEGHLGLLRLAQEHAEQVVASIFVNPLQFGLNEDWDQYPRTFESDVEKLDAAGCHQLFCPPDAEMYPNGQAQQTRVICEGLTDILCGASRPGHFAGVTTVVAKLLNIVAPEVAIFGEKDWQQLALIRRMVADLCIPVKILGAPVARAEDGLALSSRNNFITPEERPRVRQLHDSLCWIKAQIEAGNRDFAALETAARQQIEQADLRPDYIAIRAASSLAPPSPAERNLAILGALFTRAARLIDNVQVHLKD